MDYLNAVCVVSGISAEPIGQESNKLEIAKLARHTKDTW